MEQPTETGSGRTIIVRLSVDTHRALRVRVAEEDTSIQKWVEGLIERELRIRPDGRKPAGQRTAGR